MDIKSYEPLWGNWYIKDFIGKGSFGNVYVIERKEFKTVYRAALKHIRVPQEENEIKNLMADGMSAEDIKEYYEGFVEELVDEYRLMSRLKGESNIVSYEDHQCIEAKKGIGWDIFIRMELLTPLYDYYKNRDISIRDVIKLGIDICKALELCQKYRIIHRDIKPENIFVSESGNYKLGDFGIARTMEQTVADMSKKGTYTYIAPEIYKGESYGSTVDIYSLGIVMYRLLNNNRVPFLPPYPEKISHKDRNMALTKRLSGEIIPPPANADARLAEIVLKACAYNVENRYHSPSAMAADLEAIMYDEHEAKIIYPEGDKNAVPSISYIGSGNSSEEKDSADEKTGTLGYNPYMQDISEEETAEYKGNCDSTETGAMVGSDNTPEENADLSDSSINKLHSEKQGDKAKNIIRLAVALAGLAAAIGFTVFSLNFLSKLFDKTNPAKDMDNTSHTLSEEDNIGNITADNDNTESPVDDNRAHIKLTSLKGKLVCNDDFVAIIADGAVKAAGNNSDGQCSINTDESWKDVISLSLGKNHIVGLKPDGRVVAAGNNVYGQCNVSDWTDIVQITTGDWHTVGLKSDGTVIAVGNEEYGQCELSGWSDIIEIAASYQHTLGLKSDGTVVAAGLNSHGQCDVENFSDITHISAGYCHTVGLKSDGTVMAAGRNKDGQCNISDWQNITDLHAGKYFTVGLKSDGKVIATGDNNSNQCDIAQWENISDILAEGHGTFGIDSQGNILYTEYYKDYIAEING